jgi:hypothetical protein
LVPWAVQALYHWSLVKSA